MIRVTEVASGQRVDVQPDHCLRRRDGSEVTSDGIWLEIVELRAGTNRTVDLVFADGSVVTYDEHDEVAIES